MVLDGVSHYNIDAIFRLCDAFLVQELDRGRRYVWLRLKGLFLPTAPGCSSDWPF